MQRWENVDPAELARRNARRVNWPVTPVVSVTEAEEWDGPETSLPNRLLARLLEQDPCPHAADYVCGDCMRAASDAALSLLEGGPNDHLAGPVVSVTEPAETAHVWLDVDTEQVQGTVCRRCGLAMPLGARSDTPCAAAVGDFQQYTTPDAARAAARRIADGA